MKLINKLIPSFFKIKIKEFIITQVETNKINSIEVLKSIILDLHPPLIFINNKVNSAINNFLKKYDVPKELNVNVSKNDLMYLYLLFYCKGNSTKSYIDYLESGLNSFNVINKVAKFKFGDLNSVDSILDFASGYGRMTRFLVLHYQPSKIWVSDIKEEANSFQVEQFKVNEILSTFIPEKFNPIKEYDIIFVGSLFSHLPEDLFKRWLKVLYNSISENGVLILSTHDISMCSRNSKKEFVYERGSEDELLNIIENSIENEEAYGTAYVSENKFNKILFELNIKPSQSFRYKKSLWIVQDLYLITKKDTIFNSSLNLSTFP